MHTKQKLRDVKVCVNTELCKEWPEHTSRHFLTTAKHSRRDSGVRDTRDKTRPLLWQISLSHTAALKQSKPTEEFW